ncbi:GH92 family glycosyl hydrolase [Marinilabilia rubra]|uniref:Alpha-mannosidase n=1 Tax=Marinilabilia rubra TaxID=2162893 RepID=A0A2U2B483_9BACT|nr:GH92 family glycosyl hydrolase [Marinilabilia rubra]PWD97875.1 alpha-mannosidase [Marinilabilia rubra]
MRYSGLLLPTLLILLFTVNSCSQKTDSEERLTRFVNPFMGTDGPGNTYPGATVPFGMVQLSPDIGYSGWDRIAGYFWPDSIITGFSHLHLTGTGAGDLYDILLTPVNSRATKTTPENGNRPYSLFSHNNEHAEPGYYQVFLQDYGINAELSATKRTGIHQYTFPEDENSGFIIDLGYALNWDSPVITSITIEDNQTISGYRFSSGWAPDQRVWFVAKFSKPFDTATLFNDEKKVVGDSVKAQHTKVDLRFKTSENEKVVVKLGISSAAKEGARLAIKQEAPKWCFEDLRKSASNQWEKELNKIKVESDNQTWKETFYTGLYQSMLAPTLYSDATGHYKGADGKIHKAEGYDKYDTFSLWDTFRAAHPLYTIMHPDRVPDMIQSMLSHYRETGLLPVWSMQGNETNMMIGYHAVPVIVDAYFKGIGGFDAEEAYEACLSNAMSDGHGIKEYRELGYVPLSEDHENWSVSKTLEYAYDDWCIAMFAKALGKDKDYDYFMKRANNWKNHFDPQTGFMRPKKASGAFIDHFVPREYTQDFCESNGWHYFWFVPQDIEGLREKLGDERFSQRLDSMFTFSPGPDADLPIFSTGMIGQYAHGNEPSHHVAYLYNYTGESWKTQKRVRQILTNMYKPVPNGHCGNEDCGQMSSWFVFSSMGFYPVNPADGKYHIGSPLWKKATIQVEDNKTFTVEAPNVSTENMYIQSVKLNGEKLERPWITHEELSNGGTLKFEMSEIPNEQLWR